VFHPVTFLGFELLDEGESSPDTLLYVCVSVYESCVVALDTSCGLAGAVECAVAGLESGKPRFRGRGGSGGGVSSLDTEDKALVDVLRERLCIMLIVGLVNSCCPLCAASLGFLGVLPGETPGPRGS
jgi:hypothetical protein